MIIQYQFADSGVEIADSNGTKISLSYPDAASLAEVLIANLPGSHVVGAILSGGGVAPVTRNDVETLRNRLNEWLGVEKAEYYFNGEVRQVTVFRPDDGYCIAHHPCACVTDDEARDKCPSWRLPR